MNIRDLILTEAHANALRRECKPTGSKEGACQFLCGTSYIDVDPWSSAVTRGEEIRLTLHRLEPISSLNVKATASSVSWDMNEYIKLLRMVRDENLQPGICHSHPNSSASFSAQDDRNESHLRDILRERNRDERYVLVSVLLRGDGVTEARVWPPEGPPRSVRVHVLGDTFDELSPCEDDSDYPSSPKYLQRQVLSIGEETVRRLQRLRIGIVGCGGTGSAVAVLLARIGIGHLFLLDNDTVSETNLNRLHGSTRHDAEVGLSKVEVLRNHIEGMQLDTSVSIRQSLLADGTSARLLRSCDLVFGCTDDHLGRLILNRLAYFYYIPVIDTGISVQPMKPATAAYISGRVTVLRPGNACLLCRGVINPRRAREESLRYKRPDEFENQVKEGYITNTNTPTPVVGTFTTETATAAVNEMLAGIAGLRGKKGWATERTIRYDLDVCRSTGARRKLGCPVCSEHDNWGRGDVQPFLDISSI